MFGHYPSSFATALSTSCLESDRCEQKVNKHELVVSAAYFGLKCLKRRENISLVYSKTKKHFRGLPRLSIRPKSVNTALKALLRRLYWEKWAVLTANDGPLCLLVYYDMDVANLRIGLSA